jgi:hypothetical protein
MTSGSYLSSDLLPSDVSHYSYKQVNGEWVSDGNFYKYDIIIDDPEVDGTSGLNIGDYLTNYQEYLLGTDPKVMNTDATGVERKNDDDINDGEEVGITSTSDTTLDNLIFYTSVIDGAYTSRYYGYESDYIDYQVDTAAGGTIGGRYYYERTLIDPVRGIEECTMDTNSVLFTLFDGSEILMSQDHSEIFVWTDDQFIIQRHENGRVYIPNSLDPDYYAQGMYHVYTRSNQYPSGLEGGLDHGRNRRLFATDLYKGDTDGNTRSDSEDYFVAVDFDNDGIPNGQDSDDDGDGIVDYEEVYTTHDGQQVSWDMILTNDISTTSKSLTINGETHSFTTTHSRAAMGIPDEDSPGVYLPCFLDTDSDNDGIEDGIERDIQTNPGDPDTDSDGIVDGCVRDYIWDNTYCQYNDYQSLWIGGDTGTGMPH